jgi:tRNA (guanine-N7-)-methyltransferase
MKYVQQKNSYNIISKSKYIITRPYENKGRWNQIFGNNNPIHLELGMGRGEMIIKLAQQNPKINYIGLELDDGQISFAAKRLIGKDIPNLKFISGNALALEKMFGKEIDLIYLTFSEPWPKKHDEDKRFTHINYLKIYDKVFKKKKHIIMKTDNKGLFAYSLESLSQYWYTFNKVSMDLHHDERNIPNIMTEFESNYAKTTNKPIYYVDATFEG